MTRVGVVVSLSEFTGYVSLEIGGVECVENTMRHNNATTCHSRRLLSGIQYQQVSLRIGLCLFDYGAC